VKPDAQQVPPLQFALEHSVLVAHDVPLPSFGTHDPAVQ
jgi:hypothetical protein